MLIFGMVKLKENHVHKKQQNLKFYNLHPLNPQPVAEPQSGKNL